ncbi:hypothetical protein BC937DRAFT_86503 [Endogone sp. FLAS-F59071]|nr:hypothetical protein BC937DRAFT_86503 [Endogone sp. FLAS-F59071]|eukprot:RUS20042.1 hypothetical protein BC937DRAFT_86503 [Endogone sp. FLAS-F59071]
MSIVEILKKRLLDTIRAIPARWKIVVVDSKSIKTLSAACKMFDILEENVSSFLPASASALLPENVTLVENIEKPRQPYPNLEAVYFLTPCQESVNRLVDDFARRSGPMYSAAHVCFTSGLDDRLFDELNRKLKSRGASKYIKNLKEMYVDFTGMFISFDIDENLWTDFFKFTTARLLRPPVLESAVFSLETPWSFNILFGTEERNKFDRELARLAKQLLSVCTTLGENPLIRYHRPIDPETGTTTRSLPYKLALAVQQELDGFCKVNPKFPLPREPPQPRATLIIVDRTLDPTAPFLHEFTYQAMMNDLLPMEQNGTHYTYTFTQADGSSADKEVVIEESDSIYSSIRHLHIAECSDRLISQFNEFVNENKAAQSSSGVLNILGACLSVYMYILRNDTVYFAFASTSQTPSETQDSVKSLKAMKDVLANLPQFQELKAKYSAHISIAQDCMAAFEKSKLGQVGTVEQNMACGETADGELPKTVVLDMVPLLDDPFVSPADKTRLLSLYIISKDNGLLEDDRRKLLEHARLDSQLREAINNLSLLDVKISKPPRKPGEKSTKKKREKKKRGEEEEVPYELSRYVPVIKKVMEYWLITYSHALNRQPILQGHLNNTVDPSLYPYIREMEPEELEEEARLKALMPAPSLRTTRNKWQNKTRSADGKGPSGARLILFVAGGITYSEIRSAYELADMYNREIFIGSTHIITPTSFINDLKELRKPMPKLPPPVAPYVAPPPEPEPKKQLPPPPAPVQHLSSSSNPGSARSSGASTPAGSLAESDKQLSDPGKKDEKKKKGGFRLFG